jgi:cytochrome c553
MSARTVLAVAALCVSPLALAVEGNAEAARDKVAMCIGCHGIPGYQTAFPKTYKVPLIGGQYPEYIVSALQAYKSGDRKHPSMNGIAASLTEQDMADIAAYYAAQK